MSKTPVAKAAKGTSRRGRIEDEMRFDVRLRLRNVREAILTRNDLEKYLKSLPDVSSKVDSLQPLRGEEGARSK